LVGWWRFDEGSGTVASDSSGYGKDGTLLPTGSEPQWVDGKYGNALSFDGINDYVEIPYNSILNVSPNISIELWIKLASNAGFQYIASKGTWATKTGWHLRFWDGYLNFEWGNGTNWYGGSTTKGSTQLQADIWYHVAITYNGTTLRYYINAGTPQTFTISSTLANNNLNLYLGTHQDNAGDLCLNGILDEVRIYNQTLSSAEIQADFQGSPDFSSKLLAKVPKGTTQVIFTLSWQGVGSINVTMQSPSKNYTEDDVPVYQKTVFSTSSGTSDMLNIKRLSVSVNALSSDENWYIVLKLDDVEDYKITVEIQK
jgi:hypothetical protein